MEWVQVRRAAKSTMANSASNPVAVLNYHAKSFAWGGFFLDPTQLHNAATLYSFCRYLDDIADESEDPKVAKDLLTAIDHDLLRMQSDDAVVQSFLVCARREQIPLQYARDLLAGVLSDLDFAGFANDSELLTYCYRVAGTVGAMMCAVLNVREPQALEHAIDMGVAMQLTNICRDVKEDAERGRLYLPAARLWRARSKPLVDQREVDRPVGDGHIDGHINDERDGHFYALEIRAGGDSSVSSLQLLQDRNAVAKVTHQLLALADLFYDSGRRGLRYIPLRSRFAIFVAYHLYKGIGDKQRARRFHPLQGRISLSRREKLARLLLIAVDFALYSLGWRECCRWRTGRDKKICARAFVPQWNDAACGRVTRGEAQ